GNLSRSMRHLNGVYTQRYNRDIGSDGPLFRGRFKAILIEADAYLLNVSRYIHRNPVEDGVVRKAERYPWSSYASFIEHRSSPAWLSTKKTLHMIGVRNQVQRYRAFVEDGIDQMTAEFYGKKRTIPILGTDSFVKNVSKGVEPHREIPDHPHKNLDISFDEVIQAVTSVFQVTETSLFNVPRGRGRRNAARSAAIYVSHKKTGKPLSEIAEAFGLAHYGSVSGLTNRFAKQLEQDKSLRELVNSVNLIINV
ncbi:MAG: hypothetical protein ACC707_13495, partial [Thiohalomonadales bacterium]